MKHKHNYLIWAVIGTALLMSAVVLADGRAYSDFRESHEDIPLAADMIAAAESGIFPWSVEEEKTESQAQAEDLLLTEAIEQAETPADGEAAAESISVISEVEPPSMGDYTEKVVLAAVRTGTSYGETGAAGSTMQNPAVPAEGGSQTASQDGTPAYQTVGVYYLADACFIGDSFTEGLQCYAQIPKADYYALQGINSYQIMKQKFKLPNGGEGTLAEAFSQKQYGKIYILLGINELGSDPPAKFAEHYGEIIKKIRELQPNALIFIQSIFHTTAKKSSTTGFKNSIIDAENAELKKLADNRTVFYLDINPLFDDETGALRSDFSGDGVHIKANHYVEWRDFLLQHAILPN